MPSLSFQALSTNTCLTCSGVESGEFKSIGVTWPAGFEAHAAEGTELPVRLLVIISKWQGGKKKKANCMLSNFLY